jgi:hypothetical protein
MSQSLILIDLSSACWEKKKKKMARGLFSQVRALFGDCAVWIFVAIRCN